MVKALSDVLNDAVNKSSLSRAEADLILEFFTEIQALKGISDSTVRSRGHDLIRAAAFLHEAGGTYDNFSAAQILRAISGIRKAGTFTLNTYRQMIATLKRFSLWMIEEKAADIDQKKIRKIKYPKMDYKAKKRDDLLTKDEFERVIAACHNSRDRALLALLYDASCRPVEVVNLKWRDLVADEHGLSLTTSEKTGIERHIRLTYSVPYLTAWEMDRGKHGPDDAVFVTRDRRGVRPITHATLNFLCRALRDSTGIEKLKPSIFRPSKITHDVEDGLDRSYIMVKNWGSLSTKMIDVYAKPGDEYVDRVALEHAGIKHEVKRGPKGKRLAPLQCPECGTLNRSGALYCDTCRAGLTEDSTARLGSIADVLKRMAKEDPEGLVEALKKL
ncbi:integrase [hydrocarbon metagenome]|uniref:Integrase n=1 Tax=hydrocarbon metagenome TaxID=938273 RepID=A0A0W8EAI5_9ZZZZ